MKDEYCCQALCKKIQENLPEKCLVRLTSKGEEDAAENYEHNDTLLSINYNTIDHCTFG